MLPTASLNPRPMNNCAFLSRIIEVYQPKQDDAVKIFWHGGNVVIDINGERWHDLTLDLCLQAIKQSFAIRHLDGIEINKTK